MLDKVITVCDRGVRIVGDGPQTSLHPDSFPGTRWAKERDLQKVYFSPRERFLSGQGQVCQKPPGQFAINSCNVDQMPLTPTGKMFHCDGGSGAHLCPCNGAAQFF